jgi:RNA 3'-terminal phosphate cyclase
VWDAIKYVDHTVTAAVDEYLTDQLLLPMALAAGGKFTTVTTSVHLDIYIKVTQHFIPANVILSTISSIYRHVMSAVQALQHLLKDA